MRCWGDAELCVREYGRAGAGVLPELQCRRPGWSVCEGLLIAQDMVPSLKGYIFALTAWKNG